MSTDSLEILRQAGAPVDKLPEAQRAVFEGLSEHEVEVLASLQAKLNEAASDVEGQESSNTNNLC